MCQFEKMEKERAKLYKLILEGASEKSIQEQSERLDKIIVDCYLNKEK